MSVISQQAWASQDVAFFLRADLSTLNVNSLSTGSVVAGRVVSGDLSTNTLSSGTAFIHDVEASTIVAQTLQLDAQVLTADSTNLFLNGIPLVTTENISSLQDWALDPAISTLQMNGNNILNASTISCITLVANQGIVATNLNVGNGIFSNLVAFNSLFVSTQTSTISSLIAFTDIENASTLNANYISSGNAFLNNMSSSQGWISSLSSGGIQVGSIEASMGFFSTLSTGVLAVDTLSTNNIQVSTMFVDHWISAPNLYVSSINGAEFTSTTLNIQVAGVSSLTANFVSTLGAEIRQGLMSSIVFNPQVKFPLNFNFDFKPLAGAVLGGLTNIGVGVGGGLVAVASGLVALAVSRDSSTNINNTVYEQYSIPTQIQFSTLGELTSSYTRFVSSSGTANSVPGTEYLVSTFIQPGTLCIRSFGDPINLADPSTVTSSIQAFGQWVPVPPEFTTSTFSQLFTSSISASTVQTTTVIPQGTDITIRQAVGNEMTFTANEIRIDSIGASMTSGDNAVGYFVNGLTSSLTLSAATNIDMFPALNGPGVVKVNGTLTANVGNIEQVNASQNSWLSTVSTAIIYGANPNVFAPLLTGNEGLKIDAPLIFLSTQQTAMTGFTNASTVGANRFQGPEAQISSLSISTINQTGLSTITYQTAPVAGGQTQPAGRLLISGNDVDLGQQDLWCQQIRLGAGNATNAQTEIIFYDANANQRGLQTALQDRTIRVVSTINANQGGYILDTGINPPFFSTINAGTSTALFAFFPSSINSTIGASTLSVIPNPIFVAAAASLSSQKVLAANTPLALDLGSATVNVGGYTLAASTLTVPVAGTYQFSPSIQFNTTSGGANQVDFWVTKNGADLPNSASRISVANNAEQIGTVIVFDTATANDQYGIKIASADANMEAGFFQSTVTTPYTRPAIPSIILNAQRIA